MNHRPSRFPRLYDKSVSERRRIVGEELGVDPAEIARVLEAGGIGPDTADKFVENVLGTYALPFGVALHVRVNGTDYIVPMVVEEPSVVAAASNAAKMARAGGGFTAVTDPPVMTAQIQIYDVADPAGALRRLEQARGELLALADRVIPALVARGGGARDVEIRPVAHDQLVVHVYIDCRDAMGANLVNTVAEALGPTIARIAEAKLGLRILSNLCDRRRVRVRCRVPSEALATGGYSGAEVVRAVVNASRFAEADPYRAATHNKGIMNGIDAVCLATGNDWRAVEAGAHAFAARNGRYEPLARWRALSDEGSGASPSLEGSLELPLALGTVGGTLRVHPAARLALRMLGASGAAELAMIAASVGLASNLAALRALATEGIQKGHMAQHARSVALAAGASGDEVDRVAARMVEARDISVDGAMRALSRLRQALAAGRPAAADAGAEDEAATVRDDELCGA